MAEPQIMVVEDEGIVAKGIKDTLIRLGYSVSAIVSSGEAAIEKAAETHTDLVLMDIVLKGDIDGIEAAQQIRDRFDVPVVYLTAYADKKILQRAKITEPYGYLVKPFNERDLNAAIEMALYKHMVKGNVTSSGECPSLKRALKELAEIGSVKASAVFSGDGVMVESFNKLNLGDMALLSTMVAMMRTTAEKCARLLKRGEVAEVITKADRGVIVTGKFGEFIFLVAADKGFDFDSIKPQMESVKDAIQEII
jgi:CheY-like chemotaxis protein/predicted regulator of Ras-like GTPase activity (Roadblock/LC7/MglB family)